LRHFQSPLDQIYHEFRQSAIKSQLTEGFSVVLRYDHFCRENVTSKPRIRLEHPAPEIAHLRSVTEHWKSARRYDDIVYFLKSEIANHISATFSKTKATVCHLCALIVSMDAIPLEYIPVVNFGLLTLSPDEISTSSEACMTHSGRLGLYACLRDQSLREISEISTKFSTNNIPDPPETQRPLFHQLIANSLPDYDDTATCMKVGTSPDNFHDLVRHPNSIAFQVVNAFCQAPTADGFRDLTPALVRLFAIQSAPECGLIGALLSNLFPVLQIPEIRADGPGTEDAQVCDFAFEMFVNDDPIVLLRILTDQVMNDDFPDSLRTAADGLASLTSGWKEVFLYVFHFTAPECLSAKMNSVRYALGRFLGQ
jgi:hypothetical protein